MHLWLGYGEEPQRLNTSLMSGSIEESPQQDMLARQSVLIHCT